MEYQSPTLWNINQPISALEMVSLRSGFAIWTTGRFINGKMDWFKGKSTGNPWVLTIKYRGFAVNFPIIQFYDQWKNNTPTFTLKITQFCRCAYTSTMGRIWDGQKFPHLEQIRPQ
jgi:hypothetical protein